MLTSEMVVDGFSASVYADHLEEQGQMVDAQYYRLIASDLFKLVAKKRKTLGDFTKILEAIGGRITKERFYNHIIDAPDIQPRNADQVSVWAATGSETIYMDRATPKAIKKIFAILLQGVKLVHEDEVENGPDV
jgi:hypothetical protein